MSEPNNNLALKLTSVCHVTSDYYGHFLEFVRHLLCSFNYMFSAVCFLKGSFSNIMSLLLICVEEVQSPKLFLIIRDYLGRELGR